MNRNMYHNVMVKLIFKNFHREMRSFRSITSSLQLRDTMRIKRARVQIINVKKY